MYEISFHINQYGVPYLADGGHEEDERRQMHPHNS